jgi:tRNA threonylcarbamoyladenosine dehydratase
MSESSPVTVNSNSSRAYTGVARLYGETAADQLRRSNIMVVGIGGVGSWAAEALARSGVGRITLIDLDIIAESNINRQIHALQDTLGRNKVDVMQERIKAINPLCEVIVIDDFLTIENIATMLEPKPQFVIDAIDSPRVKSHLIAFCVQHKIGLAVSGAAGGRDDPLALQEVDLALTTGDALLSNTRSRMRRDFGFSRIKGERFGVRTVCSRQVPLQTLTNAEDKQGANDDQVANNATGVAKPRNNGAPLNCAGYGSIVTVTAAMGLALASIAIKQLVAKKDATNKK